MLSNKPRFQRGKCVIRAISNFVLETTKFLPKEEVSFDRVNITNKNLILIVYMSTMYWVVAPHCCTTLLHHFVAPLCCTALLHHFVAKNTENGSLVGTSVARNALSATNHSLGTMLYGGVPTRKSFL